MKHAVSRPRMLCLSLVLAGMLVLGHSRSAKGVTVQVAPADPPPVLRNGASTPALAPALAAPSSPAAYNSVTGASTVTVTPASRDYGTVKVGQSTSNTFSVANTSTHDLDATTVAVGAPFAIVSPSSGILTVPKGTSKNVIVRFSPVAAGTFAKSVTFDNPNWVTTVSVTGKGALSPVAQFSATPTNGAAPLTVTFTDSSTGTITNRVWSFGDGVTIGTTVAGVSHVYAAAGTYTVQLSAYGPVGVSTLARTNYIAVAPPVPALLQVTPAGLDFGIVATGLTAQAGFTVTNAGGLALTGSMAVAYGPFTLSAVSYSVPGYGWTNVTVYFSPSVLGLSTGSVLFAGNGGALDYPLSGVGTSPAAVTVIRLGAAAYSGAEGGKVKIKVLREGGSAGTVSVHYLTQNGTALAGSDYTAKAGTLTWLDGDAAAKVVTIAIRLDALVELKEQFKLKLNLPTGAILGTPALAKISIVPAVVKAAAPLAAAGSPAPVGQAGGAASLAEALDAAGLAWLTSPQAPWLAESAVTADGIAAARSGAAAAGQVSWLQTRVDGPGTLAFAWALAGTTAEAGLFLENGKVLGRIGAGEAWLPEAVALGNGPHILEWVYVGGTTPEAGALYVDKVLWVPAP